MQHLSSIQLTAIGAICHWGIFELGGIDIFWEQILDKKIVKIHKGVEL